MQIGQPAVSSAEVSGTGNVGWVTAISPSRHDLEVAPGDSDSRVAALVALHKLQLTETHADVLAHEVQRDVSMRASGEVWIGNRLGKLLVDRQLDLPPRLQFIRATSAAERAHRS